MPASSSNNAAAAALLCLLAAACSPEHEIDRPGTWKPTGANEHNLRAMLADRRDLDAGSPSRTDRGNGAARAVTRLLTDRRRPLINLSTSRFAAPADSSDSGGGGASSGGTQGAGAGAQ